MTSDRWRKIEQLYHEALKRAPGERGAFLDAAFEGDPLLRRDVEKLIAGHEEAGSFLDTPAWEVSARMIAADRTMAVRADVVGQEFSHYRVVEKLGEGGMGVVYRAVDTRLNRPVAIKMLSADAMIDAAQSQRFVQEARAASALNHPHIITVYEIDAWNGVDFIAMECLEGTTLQELIARRGLKLRDALKYAAQMADALAAAHRAGIVHRDLKPANVMITPRGDVKVLDFGLAKLLLPGGGDGARSDVPPRTEVGTILGTVAYMSPEQAEGRSVDARSDIFSFGSLLYEMVTGRRAFEGETQVSTLAAILHTQPKPVAELVDGVPAELERIISHCLRKDPDRRFQHLDDVKTLVEQLREESDPAIRITARVDAPAGRPPWRRGAALAAALAIAAIAGGVWWQWIRGGTPTPGAGDRPAAAPAAAAPARPRVSSGGPASANAEANRYFENAMQVKVNYDVPRAQRMLERALELDPTFAEARAWYAFTNWMILDGGYANDGALLYKAEEDMRRALADEPTLARAHAGFAAIYLMQGRKELMPAKVAQALATNPDDEDAQHWLMHYHTYSGNYDEARRVGQQILARIPLFFPTRMILGDMLRQQGNLPEAIREQQRILEQDPQNVYALRFLARAHMDASDLAAARQALDRIPPVHRQSFRTRLVEALLLAREERRREARRALDGEVLKWAAMVAHETAEVAVVYAALADRSAALDWLDRAVRSGDERAEYFRRTPLLASIRDHPRFAQLLESIAYRRAQRKAP